MKAYGPIIAHALIGILASFGFTVAPEALAHIAPVLVSAWMVLAIVMHMPAIARVLAREAGDIGLSESDLAQISALLPSGDLGAAVKTLGAKVDAMAGKPVIDPDLLDKLAQAADVLLAPDAKPDAPPATKVLEEAQSGASSQDPAKADGVSQAQPQQVQQGRHFVDTLSRQGGKQNMRFPLALIAAMALACALGLSACANMSDPTTQIVAAESAYAAAVSAEIVWMNSGKADVATVVKIESLRLAAHDALAPLAAEASAGTAPSSDLVLAAQAAVDALAAAVAATSGGN